MKQRLRTLIRSEGWHLVETKNVEFSTYREMRSWCNTTFAQNTWEGKSTSDIFTMGPKKFVFKNERDKTMFLLRWNAV